MLDLTLIKTDCTSARICMSLENLATFSGGQVGRNAKHSS